MANYNIDIVAQIKGNEKLTRFSNTLKGTSLEVKQLNKFLKEFQQGGNGVVKSFDTLNNILATAKVNFNAVASGTKLQEKAARELVLAEKLLNKEYKEREQLLNRLRTSYTPMPLPGSGVGSDPVAKSIARRRRKLMRGANQYSGPIGPGEAVSANLRSPLPPSESIFRGQSVNIEKRIEQALETRKQSEKEVAKIRERLIKKEEKLNATRKRILKEEIRTRTRILRQNQFGNVNPGMGGFRAFSQNPLTPIDDASAYSSPIGPMPRRRSTMDRLRGQFAEGGMFAGTRNQRIRGATSSALIGGGFPLLFGQGGLGAALGGIGGGIGGALGGGFGFGLSIAGTAIAQQIQQTLDFRKSIRELNKEMGQMGISSNISARGVRQLGKSLGITKEEAVKALQEFKRFGNNAILFARSFGGDFAKFDALSQANTVESALSAIRKINKDLTLEDELKLILSIKRKGVEATINDLITDTLEKQKELDTKDFRKTEGSNRIRPGVLRRQSDELKTINERNAKTVEELTKVRDLQNEIRIASEENSYSIVKGLQDVNAEIRRLNSAQFQIVELSKTLGSAFSESFKGIIKGTMSVQDALRNMFMRIADHFLDMAAQMMAAQISKGFLGLFGNMFGGAASNAAPLITDDVFNLGFDTSLISAGAFANGGYAQRGKSYLVGEKGPEMFTPGAVGGQVSPMGSTNIVVNVDASGSAVEGDEEQGKELGRLISVAVQSEIIQQQRPGGLLA